MRRILYLLSAILLLSCEHKELCFHHPHTARVRLNVDWQDFDKETPTGMTVVVYGQDGKRVTGKSTNETSHTLLDLEAGYYSSIVFNQSHDEFSSVLFTGMDDFGTARIRCNEYSSRWYVSRSNDEYLAAHPEWIGTDVENDIEVTTDMVNNTADMYLSSLARSGQDKKNLYPVVAEHLPQNIIHTIHVKVHIKNIYNMRSARASLHGLAGSYSFQDSGPTDEKVTHLLEQWSMTVDPDDPTLGYISSKITSLGLPAGHGATPEENTFNLSLLLVDEKTILDFPFNVGDHFRQTQEHEDDLQLEIELYIDEALPDVEPFGNQGGGFNATVDDWGEEENIEFGV